MQSNISPRKLVFPEHQEPQDIMLNNYIRSPRQLNELNVQSETFVSPSRLTNNLIVPNAPVKERKKLFTSEEKASVARIISPSLFLRNPSNHYDDSSSGIKTSPQPDTSQVLSPVRPVSPTLIPNAPRKPPIKFVRL